MNRPSTNFMSNGIFSDSKGVVKVKIERKEIKILSRIAPFDAEMLPISKVDSRHEDLF